MAKQLVETVASPVTKKGSRWKVVLAVPGKGQSATYTRDGLMQYGPDAVPPGTKSWIGHAKPQDRDPRNLLGKFPEGAYYDDTLEPKDKYPEGGLVAHIEPRASYEQLLEELGEDAEFSIFMDGDVDDNGVVTAMYPARTNSVDLVAYGGLEGANLREKLMESLSISEEDLEVKPSDESSAQDKKEGSMDKETQERFDALDKLINSLVENKKTADQAALDAEAEAKAEELAQVKVDEVLDKYEADMKAIDEAELLPSMQESLRAEARKGTDIAPLIESMKKIVDEARTTLSESLSIESVRFNEKSNKDSDLRVDRWAK